MLFCHRVLQFPNVEGMVDLMIAQLLFILGFVDDDKIAAVYVKSSLSLAFLLPLPLAFHLSYLVAIHQTTVPV